MMKKFLGRSAGRVWSMAPLAVAPLLFLSTCGGGDSGGTIRPTTPEWVIREGSENITMNTRIRVTVSPGQYVRVYTDGLSPRWRTCYGDSSFYGTC